MVGIFDALFSASAIALQIVEAHGERLTLSSQVDQGSLFQIDLPIVLKKS